MRELKIDQSITGRDIASVNKYMNEIGKIPLLTIEEEVQLTRKVRAGDELALERLVRTNLRFVVSVAKKYQHRGLSLGDLINEGNLGLIRAATRFDDTKGFKFISFAVWWIRQSIMLAIAEQTRTIRLPLNIINSITQLNKTLSGMEQRLERIPTAQEVAVEVDMAEQRIAGYLREAHRCVSLDKIVNPEVGSTLLDIIVSSDPAPDDVFSGDATVYEVEMLLKALPKREAKILRLYYGLAGSPSLSLDDIAVLFKLSKERVRQLKDKGLSKLRLRILRHAH
jgi:RNA polymerase primary sigma factor